MHLAQVFQVEKDMKITCSQSNNKNSKSTKNEELKNGVSWTPSHDIYYGTSQDITWQASYIKYISVNSLLTLISVIYDFGSVLDALTRFFPTILYL